MNAKHDMPPDVLTVTANPAIDRTMVIRDFTPGAVNRAEQVAETAGGKGVNVAAALADYGLRVAATGLLGAENDSPFRELFERKAIHDAFVRFPGSTREGIKIVDPTRAETTDINVAGPAPVPRDVAALRQRIGEVEARWVIFAGSLPPGVDTGFWLDLIAMAKSRGARVGLDTSGVPLSVAIAARPNFIKPNLAEFSELCGRSLHASADIVAAAREIVAGGVELVVVSMGAQGAWLVTVNEAVLARSRVEAAAGTVGAGDAMVAGLVAANIGGLALPESARLCTAFSTHTLRRRWRGDGTDREELVRKALEVSISGLRETV